MVKWLTDLWRKLDTWMHPRSGATKPVIPNTYHRSNLHGRLR